MPRIDLIQFRRGNDTAWEADPILASGEPGIDLSNNLLKVGDGLRPWSELYAIGSGLGGGGGISKEYVLRDVEITQSDITTFSIPSGYTSGQIDIWQNGVKLLEHLDFSATGGTDVSFSHPAPSGSSIEYILNMGTNLSPSKNIVEDITPQLGGNLDINNKTLMGHGSVDIYGSGSFVSGLSAYSSPVVVSNTGYIEGASVVNNIVTLSQADYDNLGSYNSQTLYIIE
tara:strand:- start:4910 stop:5593 length:684 start_codon:yes stop_codon:yes gene_type:complete